MPRYRVSLQIATSTVVEAANPYEAAIRADGAARFNGVNVDIERLDVTNVEVEPARRGRPAGATKKSTTTKKSTAATPTTRKKRAPLSPEARARLAQNLVKARAARAKKAKAAKRAAKRR